MNNCDKLDSNYSPTEQNFSQEISILLLSFLPDWTADMAKWPKNTKWSRNMTVSSSGSHLICFYLGLSSVKVVSAVLSIKPDYCSRALRSPGVTFFGVLLDLLVKLAFGFHLFSLNGRADVWTVWISEIDHKSSSDVLFISVQFQKSRTSELHKRPP